MMRIDAHQHFWQYTEEDYDWIGDDMSLLQKDFLPNDLSALLHANNVQGCVAVQARQSLTETRWLLELAEQCDMIKGVVGWVDLRDPDLATVLKEQSHQKLKGFRHVLQGEAAPDFMLQTDFVRGIKTLAETGYSYDILVTENQLPQVIKLIHQLPAMNLVIDHIAKPVMKNNSGEEHQKPSLLWLESMAELAKYPHVFCKLSGMITEANWRTWQPEDIHPYIAHVYECFGAERLMFGSDWPVCLVAGSYQEVIKLLESTLNTLTSHSNIDNIMGKNAQCFYQL